MASKDMKLKNKKLLKETAEKEIMVFCPNCVQKERQKERADKESILVSKLKEIIKSNSTLISLISLATWKDDKEEYFPETDDWLIIKHFKCEKCGDKYVGQYNLVLEKNLTLDEGFKHAKDQGNNIFSTYRVKKCKTPCPIHCKNT
jgi:hypothetical protein